MPPIGNLHMSITFSLVTMSIALGFALAMDAFSVSLANGLGNPRIKLPKMSLIAGVFAFFQALMPMIGWFFVHEAAACFDEFKKFIPWIALALLAFIGGKMILDCVRGGDCENTAGCKICPYLLFTQGIATSIDALSVGFTTADYSLIEALVSSLIIAVVTFIICFAGVVIGKKFGTKLAGKAGLLGGIILIVIGIEIFIKGVFFGG